MATSSESISGMVSLKKESACDHDRRPSVSSIPAMSTQWTCSMASMQHTSTRDPAAGFLRQDKGQGSVLLCPG